MSINKISIDITCNPDKELNKFKRIDKLLGTNLASSLKSDISDTVYDYSKEMESITRNEAHIRTGALRDSISLEKKAMYKYTVGVDSGKLIADKRNLTGTDYSIPYHDGHIGYRIVPRRAKVLHWIDENGNDRFAKYVDIPASSGDKFIKRAVDNRPKL